VIIDISYYQKPELINYDKLALQIDGAILRVGYGTGAPGKFEGADPAFERHYDEFHKRGIPVGAYHYITEYQPIEEQARLFIDTVRGKEMELGYWCDVELEDGADQLSGDTVIRWMELVEAELGRVGIYTGQWCWYRIMGSEYARYSDRLLWMSAYTESPDRWIPIGWDDYYLWQYTSTGKLDGYVAWDKELQKYVLGNLDMSKRGQMYPNKLVYPIDPATRISQKFGANPGWYPTSKGHNGIDWAAAVGTPVYAMQDGVVIIAEERQEKSGYGRQVRIQHNEGISIYGHLSKLMVSKNDTVKAGQQIGLSGGNTDDPCSGFSTGPHLHAEYRLTSGAPQVPGGYVYNAIDILPLLTVVDYKEVDPLYRVRVTIPNLLIRSGAGASYPVVKRYASGEYDVYEEQNGYGRIGDGRWIALEYTEKVGELTLEERVTALEDRIEKLEALHG